MFSSTLQGMPSVMNDVAVTSVIFDSINNQCMDPRYPIGKYSSEPFSEPARKKWLQEIQFLPAMLETAIENLDAHQLDTPYREGGWNLRQVVHHVADSHMNAYIRFKLGLTETDPAIKPYDENKWAALEDVERQPVNISITLLYALHSRWHSCILTLDEVQWQRTVFHPQRERHLTLWELLGMYAWHGRHHVAHITQLREVKGW
jgi:uncharacterized damage-inducible protein DinB